MTAIPDLRVGDGIHVENLSVFPLFVGSESGADYILADEAIASGAVTVEEVTEGGSVPNLRVTNKGDRRVLFLEGEELRGAKQNRVLNTSVLVAAASTTTIPVSCVEQGRWRYRSRTFAHGGSHSSPKLRTALKRSVTNSLKAGRGHLSDQGAVWAEVARASDALSCESDTGALADAYEAKREDIAARLGQLKYVEGASGVAVALGEKVVAIDMFDRPETCRKAWDRLLGGSLFFAIEPARGDSKTAAVGDVEAFLSRLRTARWDSAPAVGEGQELRAEVDPQTFGSALVFADALLHGSAVVDC